MWSTKSPNLELIGERMIYIAEREIKGSGLLLYVFLDIDLLISILRIIYGVYHHFQQHFSYIVAVSFIGGGNWSTRRKPSTCRHSLTNFITWCCNEYASPWTGFELTTLVVIGTDCTGSCKSNYHAITTTTAPLSFFKVASLKCQTWLVFVQQLWIIDVCR